MHLHKTGVEVLHILIVAAPVLTQRHDVAHKLVRRDDSHLDIGLIRLRDGGHLRVVMGVIDHDNAAVRLDDLVDDRGERGDKVKVKLALKPLLNDLHVQHTEKTAAEAEAERDGAFRLIRQ